MAPGFDHLRPHRRLVGLLEAALDCLEEALTLEDTLGVLPHWARMVVRELVETLVDLLERISRESPRALAPLSDAELGEDTEEEL